MSTKRINRRVLADRMPAQPMTAPQIRKELGLSIDLHGELCEAICDLVADGRAAIVHRKDGGHEWFEFKRR